MMSNDIGRNVNEKESSIQKQYLQASKVISYQCEMRVIYVIYFYMQRSKYKFFSVLVKQYVMKTYRTPVEEYVHTFLTSVPDGSEWLASRSECYTFGKCFPEPIGVGGRVGLRTHLYVVKVKLSQCLIN
jgi:hypothetical protein